MNTGLAEKEHMQYLSAELLQKSPLNACYSELIMEKQINKGNRLLLFDIDGTLTDSVSLHQAAFRTALTAFGFVDFDDNWSGYKHHTDSYIFKTIFETLKASPVSQKDIDTFEGMLADLISDSTSENRVVEIPGARNFLQQMRSLPGYDIVFATGSLLQPAQLKLAQCGITIAEQLLIASNHFFSREELVSQAIREARKYYGVHQYDEVFSFGDGRWDYETAKNLNLKFIGINNPSLVGMGVNNFYADFSDSGLFELLGETVAPEL